jgi:beta-lactamase class D
MGMRVLTWVLVAGTIAASSVAQEATHRCVVLVDQDSGSVWRSDATACATRLAPASTFKIPHALVALETGVVTPDAVEKWDGTTHDYAAWNRDHTIASAMLPSVVWLFQRIAPRVGAERMREWLTKVRYGNADTSGDVTMYWLNGTLRISPDEQAMFLRDLYGGRLPFAPANVALIRGALELPPGTVRNADGAVRLADDWPAGATWRAKTGRTRSERWRVNWLVGDLAINRRKIVFASAVWRADEAPEPMAAGRLALDTFRARGLLKASERQ